MNTKLIAVFSIIALLAFVFVSYKATNTEVKTDFPEVAKILADDNVKKGTGKAILTEYADLQCPACMQFHVYIQQQEKDDKAFAAALKKYTFVYRHFPLENIHKNARPAAVAAQAIALQGKFFEFVDVVYRSQDKWSTSETPVDFFVATANDLGVDVEQFKKDMESDAVKKKIDADVQSGIKAQLDSTPTFYINGEKLSIGSFDEFKRIIIEKAQ